MVTANEMGVRRVYTSVTLGTGDSDGAEEEDENLSPIRLEDSMGLRLHLVQEEREI